MWYIKSITCKHSSGKVFDVHSLQAFSEDHQNSGQIILHDTVSGRDKCFNLPLSSELEDFLDTYEVHGYHCGASQYSEHTFVVSSEADVRFQSLVSQVSAVSNLANQENLVKMFAIPADDVLDDVLPVDEAKTIFLVSSNTKQFAEYVTLFQLVCLVKAGWYGDSFYVVSRDRVPLSGYHPRGSRCVKYQIDFTNSHEARLLATKAIMLKNQSCLEV